MLEQYREDEKLINQITLRLYHRGFKCKDQIRKDLQRLVKKYPDIRICDGCKRPVAKCYCNEIW